MIAQAVVVIDVDIDDYDDMDRTLSSDDMKKEASNDIEETLEKIGTVRSITWP